MKKSNSNKNSTGCWDEHFTEQQLLAIDAIEATYHRPPTSSYSSSSFSSSSSSSYLAQKRKHDPHHAAEDLNPTNTIRRQLPDSIVSEQRSKNFSLAPCQDLKMRYPPMRFSGGILYSRTYTEVEKAAAQFLKVIEAKRRENSTVPIGFDIEWKPNFVRGAVPTRAAVMQLCVDISQCHVMHIIHSGITPSLQLLLEDPTIQKVGVGIGGDIIKISKDYNVTINNVEDLSILAKKKIGGENKVWGLASLTEKLVCKELQKPKKIRLGNWQCNFLSKGQLEYAATDAFVSWHLHQVLISLPDLDTAALEEGIKELKVVSA